MNRYHYQVTLNDRLMYDGIVHSEDKATAESSVRKFYGMTLGDVLLTKVVPHGTNDKPTFTRT